MPCGIGDRDDGAAGVSTDIGGAGARSLDYDGGCGRGGGARSLNGGKSHAGLCGRRVIVIAERADDWRRTVGVEREKRF